MNKKNKNLSFLVTGCGGDIGYSIGKILINSNRCKKVIGCDSSDDHGAKAIFQKCVQVPKADDKNYYRSLQNIIESEDIDVIIPTSEQEIEHLPNDPPPFSNQTTILMNDKNIINTCMDKLECMNFLKNEGITVPWTIPISEGSPLELPCILKKRRGAGGVGLLIIEDKDLLSYCQKKRPEDILQQLLIPEEQEYTCGVFRSRTGETRSIALQRTLTGTISSKGTVRHIPSISNLCEKIAVALNLRGSINVQLKLTKEGPILFEINPRFSSTVLFRHLMGFSDVIWSIEDMLGETPSHYIPPKDGLRFYRLSHEVVLPPTSEVSNT